MPRLEAVVVAERQRPRPDERHLAAQHVDHVRDLVDREAAQDAPDHGDARIVADLEERPRRLVRVLERRLLAGCPLHHRAELEHPEALLAEPDAHVGVENRAARGELDEQRDQKPQREPDEQDRERDDDVEDPLHGPLGTGEDRRAKLEERQALARNVLAPLDQELGRARRDPHLHPSAVRGLGDLEQALVGQARVGDDQLVQLGVASSCSTSAPGETSPTNS